MPNSSQPLHVSVDPLVARLFQFISGRQAEHRAFVSQVLTGLLTTHSPWLSHLARAVAPREVPLIRTEQRLSHGLRPQSRLPWNELETRATELACFDVKPQDVIAFDPGDLVKEYAEKMDSLYRVHDGSRDSCGWGYEEFSIEAVQWKNPRLRLQIPLYQKLTNASRPDYHSQTAQMLQAIESVYSFLGENKGIWTFDRAHDRSFIFTKGLLSPQMKLRWILRAKENRSVDPENQALRLPRQYHAGVFDIVKQLKLSDQPLQLRFPMTTAPLYLAYHRIRLMNLDTQAGRWLSLVVAHDRRNQEPVVLLTNLEVHSLEDALLVFGHYLERWRIEEKYRFLKTALHLERIRCLRWERIEHLAWLTHLAYFYVTLFYRAAPERVDAEIERRLRHFEPVSQIQFRYYRVAQLIQCLLIEQNSRKEVPEPLTDVA
jgi:hypothetical protein